MLTTARNAPAKARKGRTATVRPLTNVLTGNVDSDSTTATRLQRIAALAGITGARAALIASLAWGDVA